MRSWGFPNYSNVMKHLYSQIRTSIRLILLTIVLQGLSTTADAGKMYKWVDENGNIRYSDRLPPSQVRRAHEVLNSQGVVVLREDAAKTEAELAAARKIQEELEERLAAEKRAKQKQYHEDQVLLLTFSSEEEMDRVRDNRLDVLETVIVLIKKSLGDTEKKLISFEKQAALEYTAQGKEVPGGLAQNIEFFTRKKEIRGQQLELKETEKKKITRQYKIDLARYRYLKAVRIN